MTHVSIVGSKSPAPRLQTTGLGRVNLKTFGYEFYLSSTRKSRASGWTTSFLS
jgi:hypothetical protein